MQNIEIISVHYKTPDLIYNQHKSVRNFYPDLTYQIIDGSDNNVKYFENLENDDKNFNVKRFGYNIHHGPGMDYAIKNSNYEYQLILDSDVSLKSNVIEHLFDNFKGYATGKLIMIDSTGHEMWQKKEENPNNFIYSYVHPYCMLIKKSEYLKYKPFKKHGAPCIDAMIDIYNNNQTNQLCGVQIEDLVDLKIRGTRSVWGINL
jgi:hypothetical protein